MNMAYSKTAYRAITLLLALAMLFPWQPVRAAASYSDISGHWAETAIERWSEQGVLKGSDGKFRPNDPMRRGELAALLNRILGFKDSGASTFTDTDGKWYERDVNTLAWQGIYLAVDGTAQGDAWLTREEAAYMLAKAFPFIDQPSKPDFIDQDDIDATYAPSVRMLNRAGFIGGYSDGTFRPKAQITRAEIVTILNNMITEYITQPGSYTVGENARVLVAAPDVVLSGGPIDYLTVTPLAAAGVVGLDTGRIKYAAVWCAEDTLNDYYLLQPTVLGRLSAKTIRRPVDMHFAGGNGTQADPYQIANQAQLELLANYLGRDSGQYYFVLTQDITLEGLWTPIGPTIAQSFAGHLDGNGHIIRGLKVEATSDQCNTAGLFGYLGGKVLNLTTYGEVSLSGPMQSERAHLAAGGIAGWLQSIGNSGVSATISGCNSYVNVSIASTDRCMAGGIAGNAPQATIVDCNAFGKIRATVPANDGETQHALAGGIAGCNSTFTGIIGNSATISGCYSEADVRAQGGYYAFAGGIIGAHIDGKMVDNCFSRATVNASGAMYQNNAGGIAGQINNAPVARCGADAAVSAEGNTVWFNALGGFAGSIYGTGSATDCYSVGSITGKDGDYSAAGFVGRLEGTLKRCYSATAIKVNGALNDYTLQGLVGTVRANYTVERCGVFTGDTPHFVNMPMGGPLSLTTLSRGDLSTAQTYMAQGWDFEKTWRMPSDMSGRGLPILQTIAYAVQTEAAAPLR